jgi:ABC-2 type transport system ATP-binding protein
MLAEVEQTVDDVVIIANGRLIQQGSVATCTVTSGRSSAPPTPAGWSSALIAAGLQATQLDGSIQVDGTDMVTDRRTSPSRPVFRSRATSQ